MEFIVLSPQILKKLKDARLTGTQYQVWFWLVGFNQKEWLKVTSTQISTDLGIHPQTAQRILRRLEDLGLIETELVAAEWKVKLPAAAFLDGSFDPSVGSFDPSVGSNDPSVGSFDPSVGSFDPSVGSFDPMIRQSERKNEGSRRFPQKRRCGIRERDLSLLNKDLDLSLSEEEFEEEILKFIRSRNPQAKSQAYIRKAWENDKAYWLGEYRSWRKGESDHAGGAPGHVPIASPDLVRDQFSSLCAAAASAGDQFRLNSLLSHLRSDFPALHDQLVSEHPEWLELSEGVESHA